MPKKDNQGKYKTSEKIADVAKWTWEGMTRDLKKTFTAGGKAIKKFSEEGSKALDKITGGQVPKADVPRPNVPGVKDRFEQEEGFGIYRGKKKSDKVGL